MELLVILATLAVFLVVGAPVVFAIGSAALSYFIVKPAMLQSLVIYPHKFFTGMDSFVFLCIPLFILSGELMTQSGMMNQMVRFCQMLVGRFTGGLAHVTVLGSMLFGGISGSGLADVSALGPICTNMMNKAGYNRAFSASVVATSAIQGPIIPPSIPMVIFASLTNVSVGALFLGGAIPGILIGLGQMAVIVILARKKNFPKDTEKFSWQNAISVTMAAFYALMMPIIIIGGILGGFFTATEAAAIAVAYAVLVSAFAYRNLSWTGMKEALIKTARSTASIYMIIAFTSVLSWELAMERVPAMLSNFIITYDFSPDMLFLLVNLFFLFNGMWISDTAQLLLFAPIFTPIFASMGVNPIHFGVVMVVNVMIGMITPPYGTCLYLAAAIGKVKLSELVKEALPFICVSIAVIFLITYVPELVLFLPNYFGLSR